jgi:microcystin-dependent protein
MALSSLEEAKLKNTLRNRTIETDISLSDNTTNDVSDSKHGFAPKGATFGLPVGAVSLYAGISVPSGYLFCDGSAVSRTTQANLFAALSSSFGTVTLTIASPCVVTATGHGRSTGDSISLTTTGALPTGLSASTNYYIIFINANSFNLATTYANALLGTKINTSGSQSGTHTMLYNPYGISGASNFLLPDLRGRSGIGAGQGSGLTNRVLGGVAGEEAHVLTTAEMPSHTHSLDAAAGKGGTPVIVRANSASTKINTDATGGGGGHNTMQPYVVMNYIIKT